MTEREEQALAVQVARLTEAVTRMSQEQQRGAARDDEHTRDMSDFRASLARIEARIEQLGRAGAEAHETTRQVDRRAAADSAREAAADNRRGLYSLWVAMLALLVSAAAHLGWRPPSP